MQLNPPAKNELKWWVDSVETAVNQVYRPEPQITVRTNASNIGWGCAVNELTTGGLWTVDEKEQHINYLEMLAVLFGLKAYKQLVLDKHVKVLVDNTTVQVTLNKMGTSHSPKLNTLVKNIWDWCITHGIWLTVARIPGIETIEADFESRKCRRNTEWCLDKKLFNKACVKLDFSPNIDLFASRINYQHYQSGPSKNPKGAIRRICTCAKVADTNMVASCNANACPETSTTTKERINFVPTEQSKRKPSYASEHVTGNVSLISRHFESRAFSSTATEILEASWRSGTRRQYECHLSKWQLYCSKRNINPFSPSIEEGIIFLGKLYDQGIGYSGLNTARSALSPIILLPNNVTFGNHPLVCRFIKGVFETRPALPKHQEIWDVSTVLDFLKTLHPPKDLSLKDLTLKLNMLLALISAQRCQTLQALSIVDMTITDGQCIFYFNKLLKASRPGKHIGPLVVKSFTPNPNLCPIMVLTEYMERTRNLRGDCYQLIISYQKPHQGVTTDTVSRWLKIVGQLSGI